MCFDYHDVNKAMKKDVYLIPNMDAILDRLRNARYISKVDLRQAYYQVPLERSSRKYTAFALPGSGLWPFTRMPFGLANAPATFQRLIDALFGSECEPYVFCYFDDIIVVTETLDEHLEWLGSGFGSTTEEVRVLLRERYVSRLSLRSRWIEAGSG